MLFVVIWGVFATFVAAWACLELWLVAKKTAGDRSRAGEFLEIASRRFGDLKTAMQSPNQETLHNWESGGGEIWGYLIRAAMYYGADNTAEFQMIKGFAETFAVWYYRDLRLASIAEMVYNAEKVLAIIECRSEDDNGDCPDSYVNAIEVELQRDLATWADLIAALPALEDYAGPGHLQGVAYKKKAGRVFNRLCRKGSAEPESDAALFLDWAERAGLCLEDFRTSIDDLGRLVGVNFVAKLQRPCTESSQPLPPGTYHLTADEEGLR